MGEKQWDPSPYAIQLFIIYSCSLGLVVSLASRSKERWAAETATFLMISAGMFWYEYRWGNKTMVYLVAVIAMFGMAVRLRSMVL